MIEVEHLSKSYGSVRAVRDISFEVDKGSVVGFLGPNGAGKSTTLRILAGYLGASGGSVRIGGFDIETQRFEAVSLLGYMPETSPLYPEMRVAEYLTFRAELKGVRSRLRKSEVERVLEEASVADRTDQVIGQLSKGYRQRVGLADALLASPPLLILDEPTAGLDPNQIREVRALIGRLAVGHTILLSTHILSEVEATCDRAIVIDNGNLVATGTLEELRQQQSSRKMRFVLRQKAAEIIEAVDGVAAVKRDGKYSEVVPYVVTFDDEADIGDTTEAIVFALAKAEIGVRRVQPVAASLEQIFSQLTQSMEADQQ